MEDIVKFDSVEAYIIELRGEKVILYCNVAVLYGVETMRINEAVKNNHDKFPDGYVIQLTREEKAEVIENFDNPKLKYSHARSARWPPVRTSSARSPSCRKAGRSWPTCSERT